MDLVTGTELLTEHPDGHLGDGHGIAGVDPLCGGRRGVSALAGEDDVEVGHGQTGARQPLGGPGMDHHGRVDVVEHPVLQHGDLATTTFFGRSAEHPHGQAQIVGQPGQSDAGPHGGGGNDVVPAGMAHAGEGVVLGAQRQHHRTGARLRHEGGGHARGAPGHREPPGIEDVRRPGAGPLLFERCLGMIVDGVAELDQSAQTGVDRGPGLVLQCLDLGRSGSVGHGVDGPATR